MIPVVMICHILDRPHVCWKCSKYMPHVSGIMLEHLYFWKSSNNNIDTLLIRLICEKADINLILIRHLYNHQYHLLLFCTRREADLHHYLIHVYSWTTQNNKSLCDHHMYNCSYLLLSEHLSLPII